MCKILTPGEQNKEILPCVVGGCNMTDDIDVACRSWWTPVWKALQV